MPRFFEALDADHNGRLSRDELTRMGKLFDEFDRNKDGSLDPAELFGPPPGGPEGDRPRPEGDRPPQRGDAPRRPEDAPREGDRPRPEGAPRGERSPEGGPPSGERLKELFSRMDKNSDGKLSKEEAPDRLKENFEKADSNKDGFVDKAELQKLFESGEGRPRRPE